MTTCIDETMKKVEGRYSPADVAAIGVSQSVTASALSAMAGALMTIALPADFSRPWPWLLGPDHKSA